MGIWAQLAHSAGKGPLACAAANNIEAIVDDSGSMSFTDADKLRVAALDLLIDTNPAKTLGAVQFGSSASRVFAPAPIANNAGSMKSQLSTLIKADDGTTNYNDAFDLARTENPNATARIFLTDGAHNAGDYANGHRGGPRTWVIGLTIGPAGKGSPDADRLQLIASETGGKYYPQLDASTLQATVNEISALAKCEAAPARLTDTFLFQGSSRQHAIRVKPAVRSANLVLSWARPGNVFDIVNARVVRNGKTVAMVEKKKLKITRKRASTYVIVHVSGLVPGKLKFAIKAKKLRGGSSKVITQISQSRRR